MKLSWEIMANLVRIITSLIIATENTIEGKLTVPHLGPNEYVIPGDLQLGVMHNILKVGNCFPQPSTVDPLLLNVCQSALFASKQINARQDLLPNITLGLVCTGYCYSAHVGLARSVYLLEDQVPCLPAANLSHKDWVCQSDSTGPQHRGVAGVIGPDYSRATILVSSLMTVFEIPVLGSYASSDKLSDKSRYGYFLRLVPPDRYQTQALVDIVLYFNWTYVGLMYSEGSYGEEGAKLIEKLINKNNYCLAFSHMLPVEGYLDEVDGIIDLLQTNEKVAVVIWFVEDISFSRILHGFDSRNYKPKHVMLLSESAAYEVPNYKSATMGSIAIAFDRSPIPGFFEYMTSLVPGVNSDDPWLNMAWEALFNCSWVSKTNDSCQHQKPERSWYRNLIYGSVYYEGVYVFAYALHKLIESKCPMAFEDKELLKDCIKGPELLRIMKQSTVEVRNKTVLFDESGDRLAKYQFHHYFLDDNGNQIKVDLATWDGYTGDLFIQPENLNWRHLNNETEGYMYQSDGVDIFVPYSVCSSECQTKQYKLQRSPHCCWECRWCRSNEYLAENKTTCDTCPKYTWPDDITGERCLPIKPDFIQWGDKAAICLVLLSLFGAFVALIFIVIIIVYRHKKLVKASNIELSLTMLCGSLLSLLMVFVFITKATESVCLIRDIGFQVVVTLIEAPLLVKTCSIWFIFNSGKRGKKAPLFVSRPGQRYTTGCACIVQACILIAVQTIAPSDTRLFMPAATEPYVELTCLQDKVSFLVPLGYNVICIVICGVVGYGIRKLPENFSESGFIFVSVATTIFAWVVFLPTYFTAYSTKHQALILAFCLLLNAYITIGCLFAPKIYAVFYVDESAIKFTTVPSSVSVIASTSVSTKTHVSHT